MRTDLPGLLPGIKTDSSYFHKLLKTGLKIHFQKDTPKGTTSGNYKKS